MTYEIGPGVEEKVASLFQPDSVLPAQYSETFRRNAHLEPEKRLMLAVLEDAVVCFQKHLFARDKKGTILFQEAEEWILHESGDSPFSFEDLCEALGFSPRYVRQGLLRWKARMLEESFTAKVSRLTPGVEGKKLSVKMPGRTAQRPLKAEDY